MAGKTYSTNLGGLLFNSPFASVNRDSSVLLFSRFPWNHVYFSVFMRLVGSVQSTHWDRLLLGPILVVGT